MLEFPPIKKTRESTSQTSHLGNLKFLFLFFFTGNDNFIKRNTNKTTRKGKKKSTKDLYPNKKKNYIENNLFLHEFLNFSVKENYIGNNLFLHEFLNFSISN